MADVTVKWHLLRDKTRALLQMAILYMKDRVVYTTEHTHLSVHRTLI